MESAFHVSKIRVPFRAPAAKSGTDLRRWRNRARLCRRPCSVSRRSAGGQALIEFALILPLLLILIVNAVNFGGLFFAWITVSNAARDGAQYMSRGSVAWGSPAPTAPTAAQISTNIVANDVAGLPNSASLAVRVCTRTPSGRGSGGTAPTIACTTPTGSFSTAPSNPPEDASSEAPSFVMAWIDVGYDYQTYIPVYVLTLPSTMNIHRQAVMRMLQ
jgi:Flp pilus assembly protein TadG